MGKEARKGERKKRRRKEGKGVEKEVESWDIEK